MYRFINLHLFLNTDRLCMRMQISFLLYFFITSISYFIFITVEDIKSTVCMNVKELSSKCKSTVKCILLYPPLTLSQNLKGGNMVKKNLFNLYIYLNGLIYYYDTANYLATYTRLSWAVTIHNTSISNRFL